MSDWGGDEKVQSTPVLPSICLEGLRNTMKIFMQDSHSPKRPENAAEVLTTILQRLVRIGTTVTKRQKITPFPFMERDHKRNTDHEDLPYLIFSIRLLIHISFTSTCCPYLLIYLLTYLLTYLLHGEGYYLKS
jgi:hypothetical protein